MLQPRQRTTCVGEESEDSKPQTRGYSAKKQTEPHRMVGWHNAVATRLGEALAETEKRRNTLIHSFLSPRFTGLNLFSIPSRGSARVARLPLPEFFRPP